MFCGFATADRHTCQLGKYGPSSPTKHIFQASRLTCWGRRNRNRSKCNHHCYKTRPDYPKLLKKGPQKTPQNSSCFLPCLIMFTWLSCDKQDVNRVMIRKCTNRWQAEPCSLCCHHESPSMKAVERRNNFNFGRQLNCNKCKLNQKKLKENWPKLLNYPLVFV